MQELHERPLVCFFKRFLTLKAPGSTLGGRQAPVTAVAASDLPEGDPMICRSIRKTASALLLASILALSAAPAHALGRSGRSRPCEDFWQMPEDGFFAFLIRLFAPSLGTMDPNGGS